MGCRREARLAALFLANLAALLACAERGLAPGQSVELSPSRGILIVHVESPHALDKLWLGNGIAVDRIPAGGSLRLVILPAGAYRWSRIDLASGVPGYRYWIQMRRDPHWEFRVEAGAMCYAGALLLEHDSGPGRAQRLFPRIVNRSSTMLDLLERKHPELLLRHPLRYTGRGRDDFLSAYQTVVRGLRESEALQPMPEGE